MKKLILLLGLIGAGLALLITGAIALAQDGDTVPAPYAGITNPLDWTDAGAQAKGKQIYQASCGGCHGANGGNVAVANFSSAGYSSNLQQTPDRAFWILTEGNLAKGMPPFKSSLSTDQRWQVLTYISTLGAQAAPTAGTPPPATTGFSLSLNAPTQAQAGDLLVLKATLRDSQGKPVSDATINFAQKTNFFSDALMQIGEAVTNDQGIATLEFASRVSGDVEMVAQYQDLKDSRNLTLSPSREPFYEPEAGIKLPTITSGGIYIGQNGLNDLARAPTGAWRLPDGMPSWLLLVVAVVILIWITYFRVIYQVFRIPAEGEIRDTNTRLIPTLGLVFVIGVGSLLVFMLIHGPYTHWHLLPP